MRERPGIDRNNNTGFQIFCTTDKVGQTKQQSRTLVASKARSPETDNAFDSDQPTSTRSTTMADQEEFHNEENNADHQLRSQHHAYHLHRSPEATLMSRCPRIRDDDTWRTNHFILGMPRVFCNILCKSPANRSEHHPFSPQLGLLPDSIT